MVKPPRSRDTSKSNRLVENKLMLRSFSSRASGYVGPLRSHECDGDLNTKHGYVRSICPKVLLLLRLSCILLPLHRESSIFSGIVSGQAPYLLAALVNLLQECLKDLLLQALALIHPRNLLPQVRHALLLPLLVKLGEL